MSDRQFLLTMRLVLILFGLGVMVFALASDASIYQMVQNAYKVTLVSAFAPLALGLYWKRATTAGALVAVLAGMAAWLIMELAAPEALLPPQLVGLGFSFAGMVLGSLFLRESPGHVAEHSARR